MAANPPTHEHPPKSRPCPGPCSGCWHPAKAPGDLIAEGELLGTICSIYGEPLAHIFAKTAGVILYQTASLGLEKGTPMIAYGALTDA